MREFIITLNEKDLRDIMVSDKRWPVIKKILKRLRKQIRGGEQSMKTRKEFEEWEASDENKALFKAQKAAVMTYMQSLPDVAFKAVDLAQELGITTNDTYAILQQLTFKRITRKGIYYIWGK